MILFTFIIGDHCQHIGFSIAPKMEQWGYAPTAIWYFTGKKKKQEKQWPKLTGRDLFLTDRDLCFPVAICSWQIAIYSSWFSVETDAEDLCLLVRDHRSRSAYEQITTSSWSQRPFQLRDELIAIDLDRSRSESNRSRSAHEQIATSSRLTQKSHARCNS